MMCGPLAEESHVSGGPTEADMRRIIAVALGALAIASCGGKSGEITPAEYLNTAALDSALSGGSTLTRITTPKGRFNVWTKRVGNNPRIKVLLLHGGPGATHEYLEAMDTYFPAANIEYYYYDQLGSGFSDKPEAPELWDLSRFVDEVEQVRSALKIEKDSFYLFGHSWGGILAIEYALRYQDRLKGLVISNMMASIPAYNEYAQKVLMQQMDPSVLKILKQIEAEKKYDDVRYEQLLIPNFYAKHILRMPYEYWPDPVVRAFAHLNKSIYVPMQGPSEMGASGKLENWDRVADLPKITVPTLVIGAKYDTMDPAHMEMMSKKLPKGRFLLCPEGSHMALYDDQQVYFTGLIKFIKDVDAGKF
jgi:proline iminopeptidase